MYDSYPHQQVRRKPVPVESGGTFSSPSNGSHHGPLSPTRGDQSSTQPPRPEPVSATSFKSTTSTDSSYSHEKSTDAARLLGSLSPPSPSTPYSAYAWNPWLWFTWWDPAWMIYLLFLLGVAGAISHHVFYASLAGSESNEQFLMLRYGVALAYLTKALLVAAMVIAFRQQLWATVGSRMLSISAVDGIFAALEDLTVVFDLEVLQKAKVVTILAGVIWLAPLAVILTPATLTVEPSIQTNSTTCSSVRTLNFTAETVNDWRKPTEIAHLPELSLSSWNNTNVDVNDPNFFDYYTSPSPPLQQVATLSAYLQKAMARDYASVDICGAGWNCSFTISFTGPGYKCSDLTSELGPNSGGLAATNAPFNTSSLIPEGNLSYFARTTLGDYAPVQVPSSSGGIPLRPPPYPRHLGAFRTDPVLWIGYSLPQDANQSLPINSSDPTWPSTFKPTIFSCEHYETQYTVLFNYSSGLQTTKILSRKFLTPIINTTFVPNKDAMDGTNDSTTATPEENYIYPTDISKYRLTAAYHSLGAMLRQFLDGSIDFHDPIAPISLTEAIKTRLIDPHSYLAVSDLMNQTQSFHEDIILSLFYNPQFLVVAWAANPSNLSGTISNREATYDCIKSRTINRFVYDARNLWLVYGFTILLVSLAVLLGTASMSQNGGKLRDTRFSSIVAAATGPGLDHLAREKLGAPEEWLEDIKKVKIGYGIIRDVNSNTAKNETEYYGFGVENQVKQGSSILRKRSYNSLTE